MLTHDIRILFQQGTQSMGSLYPPSLSQAASSAYSMASTDSYYWALRGTLEQTRWSRDRVHRGTGNSGALAHPASAGSTKMPSGKSMRAVRTRKSAANVDLMISYCVTFTPSSAAWTACTPQITRVEDSDWCSFWSSITPCSYLAWLGS